MADLRVAKEKLRKAKERETRVEHDSRKLHEQMVRLQEKNKKLQSQLAQYEKHSNGHAGDRQKRKMVRGRCRCRCAWGQGRVAQAELPCLYACPLSVAPPKWLTITVPARSPRCCRRCTTGRRRRRS